MALHVRRCAMLAFGGCVTLWWLATPARAGDACEAATLRVEGRSPFLLECRELHTLDGTLRTCGRPVGDPGEHRLEFAQKGVTNALEHCVCAGAPSAGEVARRVVPIRAPRQLVMAELALEQAARCATTGERDDIDKLKNIIAEARRTQQYCSGSQSGWERISQSATTSCSSARVDRTSFERWLECRGSSDADHAISTRLREREQRGCKPPPPPPPPACETILDIAARLHRSAQPEHQQRLWNLVATELIAATSARATETDRVCAKRVIATVVAGGGVPDRQMFEWLMSDPELRDRYIDAVQRSLRTLTDAHARKLIQMLATPGIDVNQVLAQASRMTAENQHRFLSASGGLGRAIESVRLQGAFEQYGRGFDVVIGRGPRPDDCKYDDFANMLGSAFAKAVPDEIVFDYPAATDKVHERIAARTRSCGDNAPGAATGPGCGVVIAVQLIQGRTPDHAAGQVQLYHVMPDRHAGSLTREISSIEIPDFEVGCKATSQELSTAEKLINDLQFEFMKKPSVAGEVMAGPVDTCGLVPLRPVSRRSARYAGRGLRIDGRGLVDLPGATAGAQDALKIWEPVIGTVTGTPGASLRFWSVSAKPGLDVQLNADLRLRDMDDGPPTASFAVLVKHDSDCRASPAERQIQAGHMIGNEVGSYLTSLAAPPPPPSRRWGLPTLIAVDAALIVTGTLLINSAVNEENRAVSLGLDPRVSNDRLCLGRGLILTGAVTAAMGAIYELVK